MGAAAGRNDFCGCGADDSSWGSPSPLSRSRSRSPRPGLVSAPGGGCFVRFDERKIESLNLELFRLHDLSGCGLLQEEELVQINEVIAILHGDKNGVLSGAVRERYSRIFREELDPRGSPVSFGTFARYSLKVLKGIDPEIQAQGMILEQLVEEARSARLAMASPGFEMPSPRPGPVGPKPPQPAVSSTARSREVPLTGFSPSPHGAGASAVSRPRPPDVVAGGAVSRPPNGQSIPGQIQAQQRCARTLQSRQRLHGAQPLLLCCYQVQRAPEIIVPPAQ